jgi:uncharacterized protein YndB with AHSA1/START domain
MTASTPSPTGRLRGDDLVLTRKFRAPIDDVWTSITDPDSTARWFGRWEGKPGAGSAIRIQMGFEAGSPWLDKTIETCEPPHRVVLVSGGKYASRLTLALAATADGCELEFIHHAVDRAQVGDLGPGWEYYLDCLVAARANAPLPPFEAYFPSQKAYFQGLT